MPQTRAGRIAASGGGGAPPSLPLDAYTAPDAAYSSRQLLTAYAGSGWQIRRASDNGLTNIGFDGGGNGDVAAVTAHGTDCALQTWYDQSGNVRNLAQATAGAQLRVREASVNNLQNGNLCAVVFDGSAFMTAAAAYGGSTLSGYFVGSTTGSGYSRLLSVKSDSAADDANAANSALCIVKHGGSGILGGYRNATPLADAGSVSMTDNAVFAAGFRFDGTSYNVRRDTLTAAEASSGAFDVDKILLYSNDGAAGFAPASCKACEIVIWFSDVGDAALQALLANARSYWGAV